MRFILKEFKETVKARENILTMFLKLLVQF